MKYLLWVTLVGLLMESCVADEPQPPHLCKSPPKLEGSLIASARGEFGFRSYIYDAIDQRIRIGGFGESKNSPAHQDVLLLYKEGVMYKFNMENKTCSKTPLTDPFHPMKIPDNATLLGKAVLGSGSKPGESLFIKTWVGEMPEQQVKYITTFTELGCLPITFHYISSHIGWITTNFFDIVVGIKDPSQLTPPPFCVTDAVERGENANFFSAFV